MSMVLYCETKQEWCKESYIDERTGKERMGTLWLKAGIWKLRGIRRGYDRGRCPIYLGRGMLNFPGIKKCREELVSRKWLNRKDIAYRKIINSKNVTKLKTIG
jgi:hypothetical protein